MAGTSREAEKRTHIGTEIPRCVLLLRKYIISHTHQILFYTTFGFHFWIRGINHQRHSGLWPKAGKHSLPQWFNWLLLQRSILQTALQVGANLLTQETRPPGKPSVIKFYLHSLCNFSFSLSLSLFRNLAAVSSGMNPSLIARDICLPCFNNLNFQGLSFQDKLSLRKKGGVGRRWGEGVGCWMEERAGEGRECLWFTTGCSDSLTKGKANKQQTVWIMGLSAWLFQDREFLNADWRGRPRSVLSNSRTLNFQFSGILIFFKNRFLFSWGSKLPVFPCLCSCSHHLGSLFSKARGRPPAFSSLKGSVSSFPDCFKKKIIYILFNLILYLILYINNIYYLILFLKNNLFMFPTLPYYLTHLKPGSSGNLLSSSTETVFTMVKTWPIWQLGWLLWLLLLLFTFLVLLILLFSLLLPLLSFSFISPS